MENNIIRRTKQFGIMTYLLFSQCEVEIVVLGEKCKTGRNTRHLEFFTFSSFLNVAWLLQSVLEQYSKCVH